MTHVFLPIDQNESALSIDDRFVIDGDNFRNCHFLRATHLNFTGINENTLALSIKKVSLFEIFSHECHLFQAMHLPLCMTFATISY